MQLSDSNDQYTIVFYDNVYVYDYDYGYEYGYTLFFL